MPSGRNPLGADDAASAPSWTSFRGQQGEDKQQGYHAERKRDRQCERQKTGEPTPCALALNSVIAAMGDGDMRQDDEDEQHSDERSHMEQPFSLR